MQDLVYFSDNGLTTTSANHLANKAKEYVAERLYAELTAQ